MKRLLVAISTLIFFAPSADANHITGGEIFYTLTGVSGNDYTYHVVLRLFRDCNAPPGSAPLDPTASMAIFERATNTMVWNSAVARLRIEHLNLGSPSPCITNPPPVCYDVGYYEFDITLPGIAGGYLIVFQRCCRIAGINNLTTPSNSAGTTYTAEIPGTSPVVSGPNNNSARFIGADTVIVCADNYFTYSFAASDPDGDQLSYSFCSAYNGGSQTNPVPDPPVPPPYTFVNYQVPYSGSSPMNLGVTLNTSTGLISGIAPAAGIYVVTVCVTERRGGVTIARQRKDLQIKVGDCDIARALLNPRSTTCDGFTLTFQNDAPPSPLINSYFWDFGVLTALDDTSNLSNPTFTFPDTGVYIVKLVTNRNQACADSSTTAVRVFPGFNPGFEFTGRCFSNPFFFRDTTFTRYGVVDSWRWEFGDGSTLDDTSRIQNPQWTYSGPGSNIVQLIVTNSKGCIDTVEVTVPVLDKPSIALSFADTLICLNDAVDLEAVGTGTISWSPPFFITNANTPTPTVNPPVSTWYYVDLNDAGCINRDSVHVRVVSAVTLQAMPDTTICQGDAIQLYAMSDGLSFSWSPAANLDNPNIINPIATTYNTTPYQVTAFIGSCSTTDQVVVTTIPYPLSIAGPNRSICYNTSTQLNATMNGIRFTWTPTSYLSNPNILNPIATPPRTTSYVLAVYDTLGCPKPGLDTVIVTVRPKLRANAGRDTSVVINQPVQFYASGGINYVWSPSTGLDNRFIYNPVGVYGPTIDSVRYKVVVSDEIGCADSAYVTVHVFKTGPTIFVPTAFTPNNDGLNDFVRPIAVGILRIDYFMIFNRWGERVFYTTINGHGWNGRHNGKLQGSGVFAWMVKAIDYKGRPVFLKGTVALIR